MFFPDARSMVLNDLGISLFIYEYIFLKNYYKIIVRFIIAYTLYHPILLAYLSPTFHYKMFV